MLDYPVRPLREWRLLRGLSQSELAKRAGVSRRQLVRIEAGQARGWPSTWRRIAETLGIELDWVAEYRARFGDQPTEGRSRLMPTARPRFLLDRFQAVIGALDGSGVPVEELHDQLAALGDDPREWDRDAVIAIVEELCRQLWNSSDQLPQDARASIEHLAAELGVEPPRSTSYAAAARWLRTQLGDDEVREAFANRIVEAAASLAE